jgi:hypothetical protein
MRQYLIKIDNISVHDKFRCIQAIEAESIEDLLYKINKRYQFPDIKNINLELWSGQIGQKRERLDTMETIPPHYDIVWVRGVLNSST